MCKESEGIGIVISSSQRTLPDNTQHSQQTNIHTSVGFEPTIPAGEGSQTYALDRAATRTGLFHNGMNLLLTHILKALSKISVLED